MYYVWNKNIWRDHRKIPNVKTDNKDIKTNMDDTNKMEIKDRKANKCLSLLMFKKRSELGGDGFETIVNDT
jgi:hypothetical protein